MRGEAAKVQLPRVFRCYPNPSSLASHVTPNMKPVVQSSVIVTHATYAFSDGDRRIYIQRARPPRRNGEASANE